MYLSGYTPYPAAQDDTRLPHIVERVTADIAKTALGAEATVPFTHITNITSTIEAFKAHGYKIIGLEQDEKSIKLDDFEASGKIMLILGEEVEGITAELKQHCDDLIEIPMQGQKESFNVSVATGIALYELKYPRKY